MTREKNYQSTPLKKKNSRIVQQEYNSDNSYEFYLSQLRNNTNEQTFKIKQRIEILIPIKRPEITFKPRELTEDEKAKLNQDRISLKDGIDNMKLSAKQFSVVDADSLKVLISYKGKKIREMASLTKIMTCYVVCQIIKENQIDINNYPIKISRNAASVIGTSAKLKQGDELQLVDILHGLMLPSGNDAAISLAEHFGKLLYMDTGEYKSRVEENSELNFYVKFRDFQKYFLQEMNRQANILNLKNTHYSNVHGLANIYNKSCPNDQAKLSSLAIKLDLIRQIVGKSQYSCEIKNFRAKKQQNRIQVWQNTNQLLKENECLGFKTGVTQSAGPCLSSYFEIKKRKISIVVFKTENKESRFLDSLKLFNFVSCKLNLKKLSECHDFVEIDQKKNNSEDED